MIDSSQISNVSKLINLDNSILDAINEGNYALALDTLAKFVGSITSNPRSIAKVFSSPKLDKWCELIGDKVTTLDLDLNQNYPKSGSTILVTQIVKSGGHIEIIKDYIRLGILTGPITILVTEYFAHSASDAISLFLSALPKEVSLVIATQVNTKDKLAYLQTYLCQYPPTELFIVTSNHDSLAISLASTIKSKAIFIHHGDHHLCLGVHVENFIHVDPHNLGFFNCRNQLGIKDNRYWPLTIKPNEIKSKMDYLQTNKKSTGLTTCTSGRYEKFLSNGYPYDYFQIIPKILFLTGGIHIHIGELPPDKLDYFVSELLKLGLTPEKLVYIPHTSSLARSLVENTVDLYISSFPMGGGKASLEAMSVGVPLLMHDNCRSIFFSGRDLVYPEAFFWEDEPSLFKVLAEITSEDLVNHAEEEKLFFEKYYSNDRFIELTKLDVWQDICGRIPKLIMRNTNSLENFLEDDKIYSSYQIQKVQLEAQGLQLEALQKTNNLLNLDIVRLSLVADELGKFKDRVTSSLAWKGITFYRKLKVKIKNFLKKINKNNVIIGVFDSPTKNQELPSNGIVFVSGWLFSDIANVESLELLLNAKPLGVLVYGYPREDVNKAHPGNMNCGFQGNFYIARARKKSKLSILVTMADGSKLEAISLTVRVRTSPANFAFYKNYIKIFSGATSRALKMFKSGRMSLSPKLWLTDFRRYRDLRLNISNNFFIGDYANLTFDQLDMEPYEVFCQKNRLTENLKQTLIYRSYEIERNGPLISIITPVYNTPKNYLSEMIDSVVSQIYPNWELCLVDDASSDPTIREVIEEYIKKDSRIKVRYIHINGHISKASNTALEMAKGDFVALLDHDDLLSPDALLHFADCLFRKPNLDWLYSDEDKINEEGVFYDPLFKGAWSPEMALTHNYTHHLSVIRKDLIQSVGGFRLGYEGVQDLDLFLRISELTSAAKIEHIPFVCYHWRAHVNSTASNGAQKEYIFNRARLVIEEALARRGIDATPFLPDLNRSKNQCLYQLKWDKGLLAKNPVTIIIPTRDRVDLLRRCISSLERTVDSRYVTIIIVNDSSELVETKNYFNELVVGFFCSIKVIDVKDRLEFNYSRLVNIGVKYATTPLVLHLNNDVEAINPGWLEDMVGWITISKVGVVGAKLIYPDRRVQHSGVVVGPHGGLADHLFHGLDDDDQGYGILNGAARNVSAVTGACLLTKTELYRKLNGFDEDNFAIEYNDVDYCLRVIGVGERIVYTPQAKLTHLTSASRGSEFNPQEHINFVKKYADYEDPFINKSLDINNMRIPINQNHYCYKSYLPKLKILFVTHNLDLGGAPIVLYELAKNFINLLGCEATIISPKDGPLKNQIENSGIKIEFMDDFPEITSIEADVLEGYLAKKGGELSIEKYDLIVSNTLVAFWGVLLAEIKNIPVIWHIHESVNLEDYLNQFSDTSMHKIFKKSFIYANRVIFQSEITRLLFSSLNSQNNFTTIKGGLQMDLISAWRVENSKSDLRKKYGFSDDDVIITIVGTTCERKGQHVFLDAVEKFNTTNTSNKKITFVIVGGISGIYLKSLEAKVEKCKLQNVYIFLETRDIYDFFQLSDAFVCASFVESFPMVILLAMAFELPIMSTNVFGIPEIITNNVDGLLYNPGDSRELARLIGEYVEAPSKFNLIAKKALAKCWRLFNSKKLAQQHIEIAAYEVFRGGKSGA